MHAFPGDENQSQGIFEFPPVRCAGVVPCCEGKCLVPGCFKFIKTGIMKAHLMDCHGIHEADADKMLADPLHAGSVMAAIMHSS